MTEIDKLRAILELESRGNYTDRAVMGGLDRYLELRSEQIRQSFLLALQGVKAKNMRQRLLADFARFDPGSYDYASLEVDARRSWVARKADHYTASRRTGMHRASNDEGWRGPCPGR